MLDTSPIDALEEYLGRWAAAHLSCEPADRRIVSIVPTAAKVPEPHSGPLSGGEYHPPAEGQRGARSGGHHRAVWTERTAGLCRRGERGKTVSAQLACDRRP